MLGIFHKANQPKTNNTASVETLPETCNFMSALSTDPNSDRYMVGFNGGLIIVNDNKKYSQLRCQGNDTQIYQRIGALTFINKTIVAAAYDNDIHVFNYKTNQLLGVLSGHTHLILSLAMSKSGDLFSTSCDHTIRIWDTTRLTCKSSFQSSFAGPFGFASEICLDLCRYSPFMSNSLRFLTGYIMLADDHDHGNVLLPMKNGDILYGSFDAVIALLDKNGNCKKEMSVEKKQSSTPFGDFVLHAETNVEITGLIELNDSFVSSSHDGTVRVWDKQSFHLTTILHEPDSETASSTALITATENHIIGYSLHEHRLYFWDITTFQCQKIIEDVHMLADIGIANGDTLILAERNYAKGNAVETKIYSLPLQLCLNSSENLHISLKSLLNPEPIASPRP